VRRHAFIPHRCHTSIGVLGAVTVATAATLPGATAATVAAPVPAGGRVRLEHPTGYFDTERDGDRISVIRTARKLFDGVTWPRLERRPPGQRRAGVATLRAHQHQLDGALCFANEYVTRPMWAPSKLLYHHPGRDQRSLWT
jgi:hypothetical protein